MDEFIPGPLPRDPKEPDHADYLVIDCPELIKFEFLPREAHMIHGAITDALTSVLQTFTRGMIDIRRFDEAIGIIGDIHEKLAEGIHRHVAEFHSSDVSESSTN